MTFPASKGKTLLLLLLAATISYVTGCSSASHLPTTTTATGPTGSAFVVGTDAPMASVTSFAVQVQSVNAIDSNNNSVSLLSNAETIDFARYNGLQTLLDAMDVPEGTYNTVVIQLGTATLGYLDTSGSGAPVIKTETAMLTSSSVTVTLKNPLVIKHANEPAGLSVDFNLQKSIQVDSSGQITGQVTPTFNITTVARGDAKAYIDEFDVAVVSVNTSAQSFVVQGPHGEQFTINVDSNTEWDGTASLSALTTSSIVQVSGVLDKVDQTLNADEVAILSQDKFYAAGQVTFVTPATGAASSFDLYVRGLLPTNTGLTLGQIAQVNLSGNEKYAIYWMHNPLAQFLFNQYELLPGQSVAIGGPASGAANAQAVTVNHVTLRNWGFNGTVTANDASNGTFQMQVNGFAGVLLPQPVTVYIAHGSVFRNGWQEMSNVKVGATVRVVGLLLKDPTTGNPILLAHYTDKDGNDDEQ